MLTKMRHPFTAVSNTESVHAQAAQTQSKFQPSKQFVHLSKLPSDSQCEIGSARSPESQDSFARNGVSSLYSRTSVIVENWHGLDSAGSLHVNTRTSSYPESSVSEQWRNDSQSDLSTLEYSAPRECNLHMHNTNLNSDHDEFAANAQSDVPSNLLRNVSCNGINGLEHSGKKHLDNDLMQNGADFHSSLCGADMENITEDMIDDSFIRELLQ